MTRLGKGKKPLFGKNAGIKRSDLKPEARKLLNVSSQGQCRLGLPVIHLKPVSKAMGPGHFHI
jgi:hypothetical protein